MKSRFIIYIAVLFISTTIVFSQDKKLQDPLEPYPYNSENISFMNERDSISLGGTFTWPKDGKDFPVVVLIGGSGAQDRNSELLGHKPFLVISDYLTRNGIAVFRVDDRGVGESEGSYNTSTLEDFKEDTEAAIEYIKTRDEIDPSKIGLVGHSLGGIIAPMIAADSDDVDFMVLLAAPGLRGDKLMLLQKAMIERKMGINEESVEIGQKNIGGAYEIILESRPDSDSLTFKLKNYFTTVFGSALPPTQIDILSEQLAMPWVADFVRYDPKENLAKIKCPVLALNGANDVQVPAEVNLLAIEDEITANGNEKLTTILLPNLNHLFQESETGLPTEYASNEQTFSPEALRIMAEWIKEMTAE